MSDRADRDGVDDEHPSERRASLRTRQIAWERPRRFAMWDMRDGPSELVRWQYRHPVMTSLGVFVLVMGVHAILGVVTSRQDRIAGMSGLAIVVAGVTFWSLRVTGGLYDEWRARRSRTETSEGQDSAPSSDDDANTEPPDRGLVARLDRHNQRRIDQEAAADDPWAPSPVSERLMVVLVARVLLAVVFATGVLLYEWLG